MAGLTAWEVVEATRLAFAASEPGKRRLIEGTPGATAYPAPFFYPEMVELIGELLRHGFDFWVISASNAWSVRWMLLHGLNPLLRERGVPSGVRSDRIVGVSTLLSNREGQLFKDSVLALENPRYADLDEAILTGYRLTSRLHFPVPTYSGKVACIFDLIGRAPYLCAGDSPGDLPMLKFSANRLWIARKEKPDYQQTWLSHATGAFGAGWILQPTQAGDTPGFLPRDDNHVPAPTRAGEPAVQSPAQMI